MFAVTALALLAVEPSAPPVRAQADLGSLFSTAGYPAEAEMRGEVGEVGFHVSIAPNGSVTHCRIEASSGSQALDAGTCRILEQARFTPARNAAGEPVADEISNRITWALPPEPTGTRAMANLASYVSDADYPPEARRNREQGRVDFEIDVSTEGRVTNCRVLHSTAGHLLNVRTCQIMLSRARFRPARDAQGNPVPDTISARVAWMLPID